MAKNISFKDFDWVLMALCLLICALGTLEIYSATMNAPKFAEAHLHIKQLYWIAAGLVLMFFVSLVNYEVLLDNAPWFYLAAIFSLMSVLLFGRKYLGARRWIAFPGFHFQPSEWVKLILVLAIARFFMDLRHRELSLGDLIKAAFAEEHGFIGAVVLLLLYFLVLMRLIHNAQTAPDRAGTFVVMGIVAVLAFHVLINVGMVVGFMPVTGIPLPLMSYGGSSVLFMFLALGMVMNVRMRRFVN